MTDRGKMREIIKRIDRANKMYYNGPSESDIENIEYDKLVQELLYLEKTSGIVLPNSPSRLVGSKEGKVKHKYPILSLNHTKDLSDIENFLGAREGVLSWKLDGVAVILYYKDGVLDKAVSRGDGYYGKDVSRTVFKTNGVPKEIRAKGTTIVRGECCLSHGAFDEINNSRTTTYANPRNLVAGLINATKSSPLYLSKVDFIAHTLYEAEPIDPLNMYSEQLDWLSDIGFTVIDYEFVDYETLQGAVADRETKLMRYIYPCDGMVVRHNSLEYGERLGVTEKYPKHSMAFKWQDEEVNTRVIGVTWSVGETGLITPIVQYEPVRLEGSICSSASLHSLKKFKELKLKIGDTITIYKANKIVPTVLCNKDIVDLPWEDDRLIEIPEWCPNCAHDIKHAETKTSENIYCAIKCESKPF